MAISDVLRAADAAEDKNAAAATAALLNTDQVVRKLQGKDTAFSADDVIRLGKIVALYAEKAPVNFSLPKRAPSASDMAAIEREISRG